jgi:alditol oxidase
MNFTPSSGEELQSEYFGPLDKAFESIEAINSIRDRISPHLLISELRTIDADNLWMSPCYKQAALAIHFTWRQDWAAVRKVLPLIEEKLAPFNGRPHWGKLFTMEPSQLQSLYAKLPAFKQLMAEYDPSGKFRNAFLAKYIFGS